MSKKIFNNNSNIPCTIAINSIYPSLRNSEKQVADYILQHPEDVLTHPLRGLSVQIGVSEASVIRFCKSIGCSGYSELKLKIAREQGDTTRAEEPQTGLDVFCNTEIAEIPDIIIAQSIRTLEDTLKIFDHVPYEQAIRKLRSADRVILFGVGNSASVANDAMHKFMRIGLLCHVYEDAHMQLMASSNLSEKDVVIGISHSGMTRDTIDAMAAARDAGAFTICITNYGASPITGVSDICLLTASGETTFDSETMASRIAQLAIIDMLYIGLILQDYHGYREKIDHANAVLKGKSY